MRQSFREWLFLIAIWILSWACVEYGRAGTARPIPVEGWMSCEAPVHSLEPFPIEPLRVSGTADSGTRVQIEPGQRFQKIFGMGASLEATTCSNLTRMTLLDRKEAIRRLMDRGAGLGMNLMRVCIGTSDFTGDPWYSYDDLPPGKTDPDLRHFSIEKDRSYILPILKLAREANPETIFFASPWSPPGWMKTTGTMIGGELLPQYYGVYARYLVAFVKAYQAEGIPIYAITVQNEPGVDRATNPDPKWHYPSCHWTAAQQSQFIAYHLGPTLRREGLKTRIWCYDHNYNVTPTPEEAGISYPLEILRNRQAARYVSGVAFHGYRGEASGMSRVHEAFPRVPIHFTEGSVFSIYGARDLIARFRNWACSYNAWVVMLDEQGRPNNGPFPARRAILGLNSDTLKATAGFEYYNYAHFMKFVQRGAVRIGSGGVEEDFNHVAFENPDRSLVFMAANTSTVPRPFRLQYEGRETAVTLAPKTVVTLRWSR